MKKRILLSVLISGLIISTLYSQQIRTRLNLHERSLSNLNLVKGKKYILQNGMLTENLFISDRPDTVKVLALRVQFKKDTDPFTTGDGTFDTSLPSSPVIDPPPHNKAYFESQLLALKNYYYKVSGGKLVINYSVFDEIIQLTDTMSVFSTVPSDTGLVELACKTFLKGDQLNVKYSEYDVYVIYHAGVGRDVDLSYDPTPDDIPSAFISLQDMVKIKGDDFDGISVENGSHIIKECIILPETESQEGYEIGLLGTSALIFGFQLGMPAMWDTKTGRSGIGRWGLMDQGSGNFSGLLPAEPCAWTKYYMGWENPVIVQPGDTLVIGSSLTSKKNKIYKAIINDHEYFLFENRQNDINRDSSAVGITDKGQRVVFNSNGSITVNDSIGTGVIVSADEYDFDLPGSGILIWHIDENVIKDKIAANEINSNINHRGVDLEEADGAQDIGEVYGFLSGGAGAEFGVMHDAWYKNNEINKLVNKKDVVEFTPDSYPNTCSYDGGNFHLVFKDFSETDSVMTCVMQSDIYQKGFPVRFSSMFEPLGIIAVAPLKGENKSVLVPVKEGKVFCWKADGLPGSDNILQISEKTINNNTETINIPCCIDAEEEFTCIPAVVPATDTSHAFIAGAVKDGIVKLWSFEDKDNNSMFDEIFTWQGTDDILFLSVVEQNLFAGDSKGTVYKISLSGDTEWEINTGSSSVVSIGKYSADEIFVLLKDGTFFVIDLNGNIKKQDVFYSGGTASGAAVYKSSSENNGFVVISGDMGIVTVSQDKDIVHSFGFARTGENVSLPAVSDLDNNGAQEILFSAKNNVWAVGSNCTPVNNFPASWGTGYLSSPVSGDINSDGNPEIIAGSSDGTIQVFSSDGSAVEGFPLTAGSENKPAPFLADIDDDGDVEILHVSSNGYLNVWDINSQWSETDFPWPAEFHDPSHTSYVEMEWHAQQKAGDFMPDKSVYNYPNPVEGSFTVIRYWLDEDAEVSIEIIDLRKGNLVDKFGGPGIGLTNNEVVWNVENVQSGIYFCRVHAKNQTHEKMVTITIAVTK